jgi:DNA-binding NarL/FixJ family response regulator
MDKFDARQHHEDEYVGRPFKQVRRGPSKTADIARSMCKRHERMPDDLRDRNSARRTTCDTRWHPKGPTNGEPMRFLVADDHELVRNAVKSLLRGLDPAAEFDEADSLDSLMAAARPDANHDLAIVDLSMPGMAGAASLAALLEHNPALPLVVLSAEESVEEMRKVLAVGALGFVPKRQPVNVMLKAIELVLSGGAYVPIEALSPLLPENGTRSAPAGDTDAWTAASRPTDTGVRSDTPGGTARAQYGAANSAAGSGPASASASASPAAATAAGLQPHQRHLMEHLSPKQRDIMRLVHRGWTNKMIARELGIAEGTVKVHLSVIFRALGVHNRATAIAVVNGWLEAGQKS